MKSLLVLVLVGCMSLAVGCSGERDNTTEAARETGAMMTDSELKDKIQKRINADPEMKTADLSIDADSSRNAVMLAGTVESARLRSKAVELARSAHPGLNVENRIEVRAPEVSRKDYTPEMARKEVERAKAHKESIGESLDDAWIHAKIVAKLVGDTETPARKINVDVKNNMVTLRGTVNTPAEKQEAERVAKETDGVKSVSNQLKVMPKTSE
jgi:hyperosmotically inducible protein